MNYSPVLLQALSSLSDSVWEGVVYRHMFGTTPPDKENRSGARWNPEEVPAIYCSLDKETAIAEGDFQIEMQPFRPKAERRIHRIQVQLTKVIQLTDWSILNILAIDQSSYEDIEPQRCKEIGGAIAHLGNDGLLVPSARYGGVNLVIYPTSTLSFDPLDYSVL